MLVMGTAVACLWGRPCHKHTSKLRAEVPPTATSADGGLRVGGPRKVAQLGSGRVTFEPGPSRPPQLCRFGGSGRELGGGMMSPQGPGWGWGHLSEKAGVGMVFASVPGAGLQHE